MIDYDAVRVAATESIRAEIDDVRNYAARMQKTQRAAEAALDRYAIQCQMPSA